MADEEREEDRAVVQWLGSKRTDPRLVEWGFTHKTREFDVTLRKLSAKEMETILLMLEA